jgi:NAD(P)H-dependent flavin oxidoreductase YrpB (nitropropane dioxygenase family)
MITPVCELLWIEQPIVQAPMAALARQPRPAADIVAELVSRP